MADNVLITVTLSSTSALYSSPDGLLVHPLLTRLGRVGELQDVQALSVPREEWTYKIHRGRERRGGLTSYEDSVRER
ncbi:hypothetical protein V8D89_004404 [Ganoderma adspersum]